jgi:hypothetical protein
MVHESLKSDRSVAHNVCDFLVRSLLQVTLLVLEFEDS